MSDNADRRGQFKFNGLTTDELRRRREETKVELRKSKREDSLNKRRNLPTATTAVTNENVSSALPTALSSGFANASSRTSSGSMGTISTSELAARLPDMVQALYSSDLKTQHKACSEFRKVLATERQAPIQEVVDCQITGRLVEILIGQSVDSAAINGSNDASMVELLESTQFEAAWVLTNIASGEQKHTMAVVHANAVPHFIALLSHRNAELREQCIWALGNIVGDGVITRDYCLEQGLMNPLLENICHALDQLSNSSTTSAQSRYAMSMVRNCTWTLSNLARGSPPVRWEALRPALPIIVRLLSVKDEDTLVDACWALAYATADTSVIGDVVHAGIVPLLVPLLANKVTIQTPALRAVGNVVTGEDSQTQSVLDAGALPLLRSLLSHSRASLVKEACWAISNITAGSPSQIQQVLDANIMPQLLFVLTAADLRVKREACWAVCNATSCFEQHPDQTIHIVTQGAIAPLCASLKSFEHDARMLLIILGALTNILAVGEATATASGESINHFAALIEEANGLDMIVHLQEHPEGEVFEKCKKIIDEYFDGTEEDFDDYEDPGFNSASHHPYAHESGEFVFDASTVPQGGFNF